MKKFYKIIGKIAVVFLIFGIVFTGIGVVMGGQNSSFRNDKWIKFVINPTVEKLEYTVVDEFDSIDLSIAYGDIVIKEGKEFAIEYALYEGATYGVENKTLIVEEYDGKVINIGLGMKSKDKYVTVYVPKDTKIDIKNIDADMGNVNITNNSNISFDNINIDADMGDVILEGINASTVNIEADMGAVEFEGNVSDRIDIDADMGDVDLEGYLGCDLSVVADMGDVDICTYYSEEHYKYEIDIDMGEKEINNDGGEKFEGDDFFDIEVNCDMGDVKLTFEDK